MTGGTGQQEDEQCPGAGGVCGGSDSATYSQRLLPGLGVPGVRGTLGRSMLDKMTQPELRDGVRSKLQLSLCVASWTVKPVASSNLGIFVCFSCS